MGVTWVTFYAVYHTLAFVVVALIGSRFNSFLGVLRLLVVIFLYYSLINVPLYITGTFADENSSLLEGLMYALFQPLTSGLIIVCYLKINKIADMRKIMFYYAVTELMALILCILVFWLPSH